MNKTLTFIGAGLLTLVVASKAAASNCNPPLGNYDFKALSESPSAQSGTPIRTPADLDRHPERERVCDARRLINSLSSSQRVPTGLDPTNPYISRGERIELKRRIGLEALGNATG